MADHILPAKPEGRVLRHLERLSRRGKAQDRAPGQRNPHIPPPYDETRLRARVKYLYVPPRAESRRTGQLSVANLTVTAVPMQEEVYDTDDMIDISGAAPRITFKTAGFYTVHARATWSNDEVDGRRYLYCRLGGATVLGGNSVNALALGFYQNFSFVREFSVADYIEMLVLQTNAATNAVELDAVAESSPYFGAYWMGAS